MWVCLATIAVQASQPALVSQNMPCSLAAAGPAHSAGQAAAPGRVAHRRRAPAPAGRVTPWDGALPAAAAAAVLRLVCMPPSARGAACGVSAAWEVPPLPAIQLAAAAVEAAAAAGAGAAAPLVAAAALHSLAALRPPTPAASCPLAAAAGHRPARARPVAAVAAGRANSGRLRW